jgi:cell division protein FtsZ
MIHFDMPKEKSSIIKVIGVGGGGGNAVNHMHAQNIDGVNFIICNTDAQAIANSNVPNKIQLGPHLTKGLGAGANPAVGRQATEESLEEIKSILEVNTKMAFITAGMGGGTGTGGAPIVAKICKDLGILTVGIVTTPFSYEGRKRAKQAEEGIKALKENVDTLLIISNEKVRGQYKDFKTHEAFAKADNVLATAAKCITDVINSTGSINVDFADVSNVMRDGGVAILGNAQASGEDRAMNAIVEALNSPLLNDNDIRGARSILVNINSSKGEFAHSMNEIDTIQNFIADQAGDDADFFLGIGYDETLGDKLSVTIIATGFEHSNPFASALAPKVNAATENKVVNILEVTPPAPVEQKIVYVNGSLFEETAAPTTVATSVLPAIPMAPAAPTSVVTAVPIVTPQVTAAAPAQTVSPVLIQVQTEVTAAPIVEVVATPIAAPTTEVVTAVTPQPENLSQPIVFDLGGVEEETFEQPIFVHTQVAAATLNTQVATPAQTTSAAQPTSILQKPTQIYAADVAAPMQQQPISTPVAAPQGLPQPIAQMPLQQVAQTANPAPAITNTTAADDALAIGITIKTAADTAAAPTVINLNTDDEERRRAKERVAKLRSLSFNTSADFTDSELENIPAYLRNETKMHNTLAEVESFYSNYSVNTDENNKTEINTLNTFLNGNKPD